MIPTLTPFWHSFWLWKYFWQSDILSGSLSGILFWHSVWHLFWHSVWQSLWHVFGSRRVPQHLELVLWSSRRRFTASASGNGFSTGSTHRTRKNLWVFVHDNTHTVHTIDAAYQIMLVWRDPWIQQVQLLTLQNKGPKYSIYQVIRLDDS